MRPAAQFQLARDAVAGAAAQLGWAWLAVAGIAALAAPLTREFDDRFMMRCVMGFSNPQTAVAGVLAGVVTGLVPFLVILSALHSFQPASARMVRSDWSRILFLSIAAQIFLTMATGALDQVFFGVDHLVLQPAARTALGAKTSHAVFNEFLALSGWARGFKEALLALAILAFAGGADLSEALGDALRSVVANPVFVASLITLSRAFHALDFALRPPMAAGALDAAFSAVLAVSAAFLLTVVPLWAALKHPASLRA